MSNPNPEQNYTPDGAQTNPDVQYEKNDANLRWVAISGCIFFAVLLLTLGGVFLMTDQLETRQTTLNPTALPLLDLRPTPPPPRLQPNPIDQRAPEEDLAILREREDAILESYGWIDRESGIVRIPIDEAMKLYLEQQGDGDQ